MLAPAYDVALILDGMAEVFVDALGADPIGPDKHNVLGASWVEFRPWGTGLRGIAIQRLALWQTRALERRNADRSSRIVVTSDDEADRFQRLYGRRPDIVLSAVPAHQRWRIRVMRRVRSCGSATTATARTSTVYFGCAAVVALTRRHRRDLVDHWPRTTPGGAAARAASGRPGARLRRRPRSGLCRRRRGRRPAVGRSAIKRRH